ncbi:MAG: deoxyribonuclease IV [Bacilli bacterium]|nr:deoxyribonuclease IV [Bacilli bacterium]
MLVIGSHVSFNKEQLLGSIKEALSYNANTFMFYTGAPQNTLRNKIDSNLTSQAIKLMQENGFDINNVICHAPYIVNPATSDVSKQEFAVNFLINELKRCEELKVKKIVLHPGSAVNISRSEGLSNISDRLNEILNEDINVTILLETMAGKGNEMGITTQELKEIIDKVKVKSRIGVCLDTCHLNDAGYDMSKFDEYLDEFDNLIGIDKIGCIHINDSKNNIASHKDRHEVIGVGTIGFDNIVNIIYNKRLDGIPKILETPYIGEDENDKNRIYPPYKFEIEMIKNKVFNKNILNDIRSYYK